jgi:hypothetical protein
VTYESLINIGIVLLQIANDRAVSGILFARYYLISLISLVI